MTPLEAIRKKCLDCSCGNRAEVRACPVTSCPLYAFRDGKNPNRKGIGNRNPNQSGLSQKNAREFGDFDQISLLGEVIRC